AGELVIDWENIGNKPDLIVSTGPWKADYAYKVNDLILYGNDTYIVTVAHTSTADNSPPNQYVAIFAQGGASSVTGYLSNESHLLSASADGAVSPADLANAGGSFKVQHGLDDVSAQATFAVQSATAGLSISISPQGVYTVSGLT